MTVLAGVLGPIATTPQADILLRAMTRAAIARAGALSDLKAEASRRLQGAGMICRTFGDSPVQPLITHDDLLLTWDGRLDNQQALRQELEPDLGETRGDPGLLAAAYRRWGDAFVEHLRGDFALALWDAPRRRLLLARDPFGCRPLFFVEGRSALLWASSLDALRATDAVEPTVDEDWVAGFLSGARPGDRSPFRQIAVVPPGCVVMFESGVRRERQFWDLEPRRDVRLRDDGEYEEAFRELFEDAVRCRLATPGTVCADLSGGLDSSSIVCVADRLIRTGEVEASRLVTCSFVFDRAASSDERPYIARVEAQIGRGGQHFNEDDCPLLDDVSRLATQCPDFWQTWKRAMAAVRGMMRDRGSRVILNGYGGDQLLWSSWGAPFELADHALRLRLGRLLRDGVRWHRLGGDSYPRLLWHGIARPAWQAVRGRGPEPPRLDEAWSGKRLRRRWRRLIDRNLSRDRGFLLPSRRARLEMIRSAIHGRSWMLDEPVQGIDRSCPFLDRPLVEFCLAIPFEQLVRPGESRSLHRRALAGILPPEIATRRTKQGPGESMMRALRDAGPAVDALFRDARVFQRDYVDRRPFLELLETSRFGLRGAIGQILIVIQLEVWLRDLETPRAAVAATEA